MSQEPITVEIRPDLVLDKIHAYNLPEIYQKNPYNRGFLCGLIDAWNILTTSQLQMEPPPLKHEYADIEASNGAIGYEAIRLLSVCPHSADELVVWRKQVSDLLETWAANAQGLALQSAINAAKDRITHRPVTLTIDGKEHKITTASELYDIPEVQNSCLDWPGDWNFNRLVAVGKDLLAEQIKGDDPNNTRTQGIGTLSDNPAWLRVPSIQ
jgi:hypothetical protein